MSRLEFFRVDFRISVRPTEGGGALILFDHGGETHGYYLEREPPAIPLAETAQLSLFPVMEVPAFQAALNEWRGRAAESPAQESPEAYMVMTPRVVLDVTDPALSAIPWEFILSREISLNAQSYSFVRASSVRPRFASVPFTLPLRILHVEPVRAGWLKDKVRRTLGRSLPDDVAAGAAEVYEVGVADFRGWAAPHGQPTAEVIHFDHLLAFVEPGDILSTARPESPGTLGWFTRVTDLWQTRLVVLTCRTRCEVEDARRLATALLNRGGPAFLVCRFTDAAAEESFYNYFYDQLIHDFPLDRILADILHWGLAPPDQDVSLFAGAGREEGLRVSTIGLRLINLSKSLTQAKEGGDAETAEVLRDLFAGATESRIVKELGKPLTYESAQSIVNDSVHSLSKALSPFSRETRLEDLGIQAQPEVDALAARIITSYAEGEIRFVGARGGEFIPDLSSEWTVGELVDAVAERGRLMRGYGHEEEVAAAASVLLNNLGSALRDLEQQWKHLTFQFHEGEGLIPLSRRVSSIRANSPLRPAGYSEVMAPRAFTPRYVNSSLWEPAGDESLRQLDRETTRLRVGETYHLGIQIGPEDVRFSAVGATALLEEVFKWTPEMKGVWVEIGVSGIDFEVLGDPVQEMWLPRDAPSEYAYFAVSPRVPGAARLRFCLYYQQNLVQSFRLAAVTLAPGQKAETLRQRRRMIASALGVTQKAVGRAGYLSRLEYSLTTGAEGIETRPQRSLSITVNDLDGLRVVTVKGQDEFGVFIPGNVSKLVKDVRQVLKEVSAVPIAGEPDPSKWNYAFGPFALQPRTLKDALRKMAAAGWTLYDQLIQGDDQQKLDALLPAERGLIHVAHIVRDKVIPWAALYDHPYEPTTTDTVTDDDEVVPAVHGVCLAALPDVDGRLPVNKCGEHPKCPLHPSRQEAFKKRGKAVLPETVVCPLHFWGFKHIIEVPPQQVTAGGSARPQRDCVLYAGPAPRLAVGFNACLGLWDGHWKELEALTQWKSKAAEKERARILKVLKNEELDIVYFYCHARGGLEDAAENPEHLLFQADSQKPPEKLPASGFPRNMKWKHHPLVILNGCGTVGFSPDALSPFLKKLVDDLGAAGVLGTEVTIWEELATQASIYFLRQFLSGKTAGDALLIMRRALLAGKNPLGLVYTLYAPAHLMLDQTGDGKC